MRYFLFLSIALWLLSSLDVFARGNYVYQNQNVNITVEWKIDAAGSETIILKLKPLTDILIPSEESCFHFDTVAAAKCYFDNIGCPILVSGHYIYVIDDHVNNQYRRLPKDTVLTYKWQAPRNKQLKGFSFDIAYIATTTREYAAKKKRLVQVPLKSGDIGLSIRPEDEDILRSKAHLDIIPE